MLGVFPAQRTSSSDNGRNVVSRRGQILFVTDLVTIFLQFLLKNNYYFYVFVCRFLPIYLSPHKYTLEKLVLDIGLSHVWHEKTTSPSKSAQEANDGQRTYALRIACTVATEECNVEKNAKVGVVSNQTRPSSVGQSVDICLCPTRTKNMHATCCRIPVG